MNPPDDNPAVTLNPDNVRRAMQMMLPSCAGMRQVLEQGRGLSGHLQNGPRWALHLERLDELEALLRAERPEDWDRVQDLNTTFMLDMEADMGAALGEANERMVRFTDEVAQRVEDRKFELPAEVRDDLDELLQPYQDKYRDEMLDALPIATRRQLEEEKRRLEEEGT